MDRNKYFEEYNKKFKKEVENISTYIFENPELGLKEFKSCRYLTNILKKHGFDVEEEYMGMDTAFRAEYGSDNGVTIAFLAEYDALPGYDEKKGAAHACGHNFIAACSCGAGIFLADIMKQEKIPGKVVVIGTPAEESVGGKIPMVENGAFDDIDVVFQAHIGNYTTINCSFLAIDCIKFKFFGKASHAAVSPEEGINALDANILTFNGINALREHIKSTVRIHGIISDGGKVANIVPDYSESKFYIRAKERKYLDCLTQKVINIARGATLMTGAKMEYEKFENSYDNMKNNKALQDLIEKYLLQVGIENISKEEMESAGSSDIGNVTQVVPTMYIEIGLDTPEKYALHGDKILEYVNSKYAYEKLHKVIIAFVSASLDIFSDEKIKKKKKRIAEGL